MDTEKITSTMETVVPLLVTFGLKAAGAILIWIIGRRLIHFAVAIMQRGMRSGPIEPTVIGFLGSGSQSDWAHLVTSFHRGLNEAGFVEGQNVAIEYRWAEGHYDRLPAYASNFVQRQVTVIAAASLPAALAAKAATSAVPVVFSSGGDPVADDPAMGQYVPSFIGAWSDYARDILKVQIDQSYQPISFRTINGRWDWGYGPGVPGGRNYGIDLAAAMTRNSKLRLMVATGWYDLVTPAGGAEYDIAHSGVPLAQTQFKYYQSGHMPYLGAEPRAVLARDIRAFVTAR